MRIIGGSIKGIHLKAPNNLPVRPTTDMAKESLFNILNNRYDLDECVVLDLFAGTGSVSIEFASRDAQRVVSVDKFAGCIRWIDAVKQKYALDAIDTIKADVFKLLPTLSEKFNIIFADPPYDLPSIPDIPRLIKEHGLLAENGLLVVEHPRMLKLNDIDGHQETRTYGNSSFSFFEY